MDTEIPGSKDGFGAKSSFLVADSAGWVGCGVVWFGSVWFDREYLDHQHF